MPDIKDDLLAGLAHEEAELTALLPRFSDEQWRAVSRDDGWTAHDIAAHIADSTYGLALLALGEIQPALPLDPERGWMNADDLNQQRRAKLAGLSREKIVSRLDGAFGTARRAIETIPDYDAPGPYGPSPTRGEVLQRMLHHLAEHRGDLERALA